MRLFILLAGLLFAAFPAFAEDDDLQQKLAIARKIVMLTDGPVINAVDRSLGNAIIVKLKLTTAKGFALVEFLDSAAQQLRIKALDDVAVAYANKYSLDDLKTISAFATSPIGREFFNDLQAQENLMVAALGELDSDLPD